MKYEFLMGEDVLSEKVLLDKATTIRRSKYSPLGSELKKQTGIAKDRYKFLKVQSNVVNKNGEDGVKTEDGEVVDDVHRKYICDEYKNVITNIFKFGLMNGNLHLRNVDNRQLEQTNVINRYLGKNCLIKD